MEKRITKDKKELLGKSIHLLLWGLFQFSTFAEYKPDGSFIGRWDCGEVNERNEYSAIG